MDLSYESRWLDLRRQLDVDIAYLDECAVRTREKGETQRAETIAAKAQALEVVRSQMDAADRVGAHRA